MSATDKCPHLTGYSPLDPSELQEPYPTFARAREEAPVFFSPELNMWHVTRQADVLEVLRATDSFSARRALNTTLPPEELRDRMPVYPWHNAALLLDEPEHRPARALLQEPFTPRSLKIREPQIRERANRLLDKLENEGRIEFVHEYGFPLSMAVICDISGIPDEKHDLLLRAVDATFVLLSENLTDEQALEAARDLPEFMEYLAELASDRIDDPRDDYTSVMAHRVAPDGSRATPEQVGQALADIVSAGFETTAHMMANGISMLLSHRDQWELLASEPSLMNSAVEEMLRYRGLVKRIFRVPIKDVVVGGVEIPEGALVALTLASANRDEDTYEEPERFDIRRNPDHLTFGKWTHFCAGAQLAKLELRVTTEVLLERFPEVEVATDQALDRKPDFRLDSLKKLDLVARSGVRQPA